MQLFNNYDHGKLSLLFHPRWNYKGYKPEILEAPNGDGKVDVAKRYLHVALKYDPPEWALYYLARAHFEACRAAEAMGVPAEFYPKVENGTLRVLDYPAGAGSEEHTDFDLFTIHCYRSTPEDFHINDADRGTAALAAGMAVNEGIHIGDIGQEIGLGKATRHSVVARDYSQKAIVYFAMPANNAVMPNGQGALAWIADRYARSRVYK